MREARANRGCCLRGCFPSCFGGVAQCRVGGEGRLDGRTVRYIHPRVHEHTSFGLGAGFDRWAAEGLRRHPAELPCRRIYGSADDGLLGAFGQRLSALGLCETAFRFFYSLTAALEHEVAEEHTAEETHCATDRRAYGSRRTGYQAADCRSGFCPGHASAERYRAVRKLLGDHLRGAHLILRRGADGVADTLPDAAFRVRRLAPLDLGHQRLLFSRLVFRDRSLRLGNQLDIRQVADDSVAEGRAGTGGALRAVPDIRSDVTELVQESALLGLRYRSGLYSSRIERLIENVKIFIGQRKRLLSHVASPVEVETKKPALGGLVV